MSVIPNSLVLAIRGCAVGLLLCLGFQSVCFGLPPERVVLVGDETGDGRYTGIDIEAGLQKCRPGCVLRIGPHRFDDVAIVVEDEFPGGLVIEGAGVGKTILRSPVPVQAPIFWVRGGPAGITFRNFTLDGRRAEQGQGARIARSIGIFVVHPALKETPAGWVESTEIREFMTAGIHIRDGSSWRVEANEIRNIGCHTDLPCPLLIKADADRYVGGRKTVGYGIVVVGENASGAIIQDNRVSNVTKIGVEAYSRGFERQMSRRIHHVQILRNRVSGSIASGIVSNSGMDIRIADNEVWDSGGSGTRGSGPAGIGCSGRSERIEITGNFVHDTDGPGLRLTCKGDGVIVRSNHIERPCRVELVDHGAIHIVGRKARGAVLIVDDNLVDATSSHCAYALFIANLNHVRLIEGEYLGGRSAAILLANVGDAWMDGIGALAVGVPSLWVRPDSRDVRASWNIGISLDGIKNEGGARSFVMEQP